MKLLSEKVIKYNNNKIRKQQKKWLRLAMKRRNRRFHPKKSNNDEKPFVIIFPESLYLNTEGVEDVFENINIAIEKTYVHFIFSKVKYISVDSALYIKAYIDSHKATQQITISCKSDNKKLRQVLQFLGLKDYGIQITFKDISCWALRQWSKNSKSKFTQILMEEVFPKIRKNRLPSDNFSDIASSISELLANCSEHAYKDNDSFTEYYFIAGEYENENEGKSNSFTLCVIDMGQGFKASLGRNKQFFEFIDKLKLNSDNDIIKATVEGRFNACKDKHSGRGAGLPDVQKNVESINGILNILTDRAFYSFRHGKTYCFDRKNKALGSIITVNLPIK